MNQQHSRIRRESANAAESQSECEPQSMQEAADEMLALLRKYARQRPEMVALACLGVGFILGWRLKPW
jgi:hypothetical protein